MLRYKEELLEKEESISSLYFNVIKELENRKKLYKDFRRKTCDEDIASSTDEEIKVPLEQYISVMATGYYAGQSPIYKVKAFDEELDKLNVELFKKKSNSKQKVKEMEFIIKHITDYNDDSDEFLKLVFDYFVKRACYELLYKNEKNEIVYSHSDALETAGIWDFSIPKNLIGIYRVLNTTMADGNPIIQIELITKNGKRYYNSTPEKIEIFGKPEYSIKYKNESLFIEDIDLYEKSKWDDIPAIAIENRHGLNVFELVISLIRAYERSIQNGRNTFKYNDEAILKVVGYTPEVQPTITKNGVSMLNPLREKYDEMILKSKVRYLDKDGDIAWVTKDINDSALQNHKKTLMDLICLCSFVPNMTDLGFTQADNNSALEKKFFGLQQLMADANGEFKKGLLRRWELIFDKFNKDIAGKNYDFRNVEVTLQTNLPQDKSNLVETLMKLKEVLSEETLLSLLPFDVDPKNEIKKRKEESKDDLEQNQEMIKKFNKSNGVEDEKDNEKQLNIKKKFENNQKPEKNEKEEITEAIKEKE